MPCNLFQKLNSMPKIFLRNDIFHSNLIDKNFNVQVLYQNEYVKSAVQVQFPEEMYAISLGQEIHSRKKNEYYSHFFTVKWFLNSTSVNKEYTSFTIFQNYAFDASCWTSVYILSYNKLDKFWSHTAARSENSFGKLKNRMMNQVIYKFIIG